MWSLNELISLVIPQDTVAIKYSNKNLLHALFNNNTNFKTNKLMVKGEIS